MAKHGKKAHHEEEMGEAWLLPYSDLMTLLLAVFIVLYAVSQSDPARIVDIAEAFGMIYGGKPSIMVGDGSVAKSSGTDANAPLIDIWSEFPQPPKTSEGEAKKQEQMDAFRDALMTYFAQNNMDSNFDISDEPSMLTLTLASDVMFPTGVALLNDSQKEMARSLGSIIYETQQRGVRLMVQVSGHTDNVPIRTTQYSSNWNLSLDRAANFMAAMIDGSQLDPRVFTAVGHGEMDPVDTNDTPEGRQKNRRVEVQFKFEENALGDLDGLLKPGATEQ